MRYLWVTLLFAALTVAVGAQQSPEWRARTRIAKQIGAGESAPDWLVNSEAYAIGYNAADWDALAQSKVSFITHCPVNGQFFERCHALGIRCFPYVTFYQGNSDRTYEGINLKDHPGFIEVDAQGNMKRTGFWESEDAKNMYTTCPSVREYQDAMVAWVRKIMEFGADGVFVDNLGTRVPCFGPRFGKHRHLYADQNHAFAMLLKRVREVVKRYKPDGAVLGNSANPTTLPKEYWPYLDAEMLESYICTWVSKDRWFDWKTHWNKAGKDLQRLVSAGKQIQALSYLGHTPYGIREDALFCYASARLAGFVWSGGLPISNTETADLYRLRLGKPWTGELESNGIHYRMFEGGLVAVNPDKDHDRVLGLGAPVPHAQLYELACGSLATGWAPYGSRGYRLDSATRHGGGRAMMCRNPTNSGQSGASQVIELNQTERAPIVVSGWSKAEGVSGGPGGDYSLYVDALYADGTPLFGQIAAFSTGTHDWEEKSVTIRPEKPIKSLTLNVLFRNKMGRVWFDDVSLSEGGAERAADGGFEEASHSGRVLTATATGCKLEVPAYSGRVYLYTSDAADQLASSGPRLTVVTSPALGEVRFRVDGFDYWTHSGYWTTEYTLGSSFGKFDIAFDKPGEHTIEIIDVIPADMKTPAGYGSGERLGQFMDPSNPTKPSRGRKYRFREWAGRGPRTSVTVDVQKDMSITATFDGSP